MLSMWASKVFTEPKKLPPCNVAQSDDHWFKGLSVSWAKLVGAGLGQSLNWHLFMYHLTFWTKMIQLESTDHDYVRILKSQTYK